MNTSVDRAVTELSRLSLGDLCDVTTRLSYQLNAVTIATRLALKRKDHPEELALDCSIETLGLGKRSAKALGRKGIETIRSLIGLSADDLLEIPNFGVTSLNEVREKLSVKGRCLNGDRPVTIGPTPPIQ